MGTRQQSVAAERKYDWGGGLVREAAKQPIIRAKRLCGKIKKPAATLANNESYRQYCLCKIRVNGCPLM